MRCTNSIGETRPFAARSNNAACYLFADEETRTRLGKEPSLHHPAADPELEDFLDFVLKAKRAASNGDELGLRWFAQGAAALAPTLLIPIHDKRIASDGLGLLRERAPYVDHQPEISRYLADGTLERHLGLIA